MKAATTQETERDRSIVISHTFNVGRERVFNAFSDEKTIGLWWGPNGFTTTTHSMDFRVGGQWRFTMHGPDGKDYENLIIYKEITPFSRIVYEHGEPEGSQAPHFLDTLVFEEKDGKTTVTMTLLAASAAIVAEMKKYGAVEGGHQTLARLEKHILGQ